MGERTVTGPTRREESVVRVYWECAISKHRHQTEGVARRCLEDHAAAPQPRPMKWTDDAIYSAAQSYVAGATLKAVGLQNGVSAERMRQVFGKALRRDRYLRPRAWDGFMYGGGGSLRSELVVYLAA